MSSRLLKSFRSNNNSSKDNLNKKNKIILNVVPVNSIDKVKCSSYIIRPDNLLEKDFQNKILIKENRLNIKNKINYDFYSIIDGHGNNNLASNILYNEILCEFLKKNNFNIPTNENIIEIFNKINNNINIESKKLNINRTGSCIGCLLVNNKNVKFVWTGDLCCVVFNDKNNLIWKSKQHRIDLNPKERVRINKQIKKSKPREEIIKTKIWKNLEIKAKKNGKNLRAKSFISKRKNAKGIFYGDWVVFSYENGPSYKISRSIGDRKGPRSLIPTPEIRTFEFVKYEKKTENESFMNVNEAKDICYEYCNFFIGSASFWDIFSPEELEKKINKLVFVKTDLDKLTKKLVLKAKNERYKRGYSKKEVSLIVVNVTGATVVSKQLTKS